MNEIIFVVEDAPAGGYTAHALGEDIFTEGDDLETLRANMRNAVGCHCEEGQTPQMVRLHFVREDLIAL